MKIVRVRIEKFSAKLAAPLTIASGIMDSGESWTVYIDTDEEITGIGSAAPWAPVTGETLESCHEVLKFLSRGLPGMDPADISGIHKYMDRLIYGNGSAKCAIDTALYDIAARKAQLPLYKYLGATTNVVVNDITVSIGEPREMAKEAKHFVQDLGFDIIKVKIGLDHDKDLEALKSIREAVGPAVRIRADANQSFDVPSAMGFLRKAGSIGIDAVEQLLPYWDIDGSEYIYANNPTNIKIMLDESIHDVYDAQRASSPKACDAFNIKLMKCGGLFQGLKMADIADKAGIECMVGCMMENKISLTAGLSLVAAKRNIVEADCDSFLVFENEDDGIQGGFTREGGKMILSDRPGLGIEL